MLSVLLPVNNEPIDQNYTASHGDIYSPPLDDYNSIFDIILDDDLTEEADFTELSDEQITFNVNNSEVENVTQVFVDGCVYNLGYFPLAVGEYAFDPDTGDVIVQLKVPIKETTTVDYQIPKPVEGLRTNCICDRTIVPLFQRWNVREADITITHNFGSEPTLSDFSFVACKSEMNFINSALYNGKKFAAFNNNWVINKLTIVLLKNSDQIGVNVSAVHWLAARGNPSKSPLDTRVKLKTGSGNGGRQRERRISSFARGVRYKGQNFSIRVPRSTGENESTTLRELLNQYAITGSAFVYYGRDKVEARRWARTRVHSISHDDIKGDIALTQSGHGSRVDGIKLHTEYRNLKVNLDFDPDQSDRKIGLTIRWAFENCRSLGDLVNPSVYDGFAYRQPDDKIFRNIGINFDAGGEVKKGTEIFEFNGTPILEVEDHYGYAYSSDEAYSVEITSEGNIQLKFKTIQTPNNYYKNVLHKSTAHLFDEHGYKTASGESGFQIARLQQESEKLEAIVYTGQAIRDSTELFGIRIPDPSKQNQADSYKFTENLPIQASTVYQLAKHADYFEDTIKADEHCEEDYIPPKFVANKTYRLQTEIIKPNPKNNESFIFPPIISGKYTEKSTQTIITNRHFPYKHEIRNFVSNKEGEYGKNAVYNSNTVQNIGKPGLAPRLDREINREPISKNSAYEKYKNENYYISSPGVSGIETNEGSKSYPGVDSPFTALRIAQTELSITNTQNSLTTTLEIHFRTGLEVGDRVLFNGKMWVLFSITDQRSIIGCRNTDNQGGCISVSRSLTITIGRLLNSRLTLDNRTDCSGSGGSFAPAPVSPDPIAS